MPGDLTSDEHDAATFHACLMLADTVRVFLLQNHKALSTLDELGIRWRAIEGLPRRDDGSGKQECENHRGLIPSGHGSSMPNLLAE